MVRTVLINLDRDADRLAWMSSQMARVGLSFERFSALHGDALPAPLRAFFRTGRGGAAPLSRGEIGCYASHLAVMDMMVRERIGAVLVLEDDLAVGDDLPAVLAAVARFPSDWDIVRLSGRVKTAVTPVLPLKPGLDLVKYSRVPLGTGAYLISLRGAKRYLAWACRHGVSLPVDQDLRRVWDCKMTTYGVWPAPVEQDVLGRSSIDSVGPRCAIRGVRGKLRVRGWGYLIEPVTRTAYNLGHLGARAWARTSAVNAVARVSKRLRLQLTG